jgi:hypothetical protein
MMFVNCIISSQRNTHCTAKSETPFDKQAVEAPVFLSTL